MLTLNGADHALSGAHPLVVNQNPGYLSGVVATGSSSNGVTLAQANNFTGGTTLYGGSLAIGSDGALGSGPLTFSGGSFGSTGGARNLANPIILKSVALNILGSLTFSGTVDLNGGTGTISAASSAGGSGTFTFSNVISNGALTLNSGIFTFSGANTFAGGLTINGARLFVSDDSNLGASSVTLNLAGGYLSSLGAALTINRPVNCSYNYATISTNGGTITINGPVTTANTNVTLTKRDAGTLILTNPNNGGQISVIGGTLQVDGNAPTGGKTPNGMSVSVSSGGILAGTGYAGYTFVSSGGHIAPGDSGPGTLSIGSALIVSNGTVLDFDLGTTAADKLVLLNNHFFQQQSPNAVIVINIADAGGLAPGQTYDLIDWGTTPTTGITASTFQLGSSPVSGTFNVTSAGVLQFTTAAYTPFQQWQRTYFGGINNTLAAPTANPAGDGINNLTKYALGLDPTIPEVDPITHDISTGYLRLTVPKNPNATDITYNVQVTSDLTNPGSWTTSGTTVVINTSNQLVVQDNTPMNGATKRFVRLQVSR